MDEITIGDKIYISSKRAAKITGYAKDYVGQLCREGKVHAKLVGRNWYVLEDSIREHRFGKGEAAPAPIAPESPVSSWSAPRYVSETTTSMPSLAQKPIEKEPEIHITAPVRAESERVMADMQAAWQDWFKTHATEAALPDGSSDFNEQNVPAVIESPVEEAPLQDLYFSVSTETSETAHYEQEYISSETEIAAEPEIVPISRIQPPMPAPVPEDEEEVPLHRSRSSFSTGEYVPEVTTKIIDLSHRNKPDVKKTSKISREVAEEAYEPDLRDEMHEGSGLVLRALFISIAALAVVMAVVGSGYADGLINSSRLDTGAQHKVVDYLQGASTVNK